MFISDSFFDKYAKYVSPQYMITYMHILRNKKTDFSVQEMCDSLNVMSKTLFRALDFWVEQGEIKYFKNGNDGLKIYIQKTQTPPAETTVSEAVKLLKNDENFALVIKLSKETFSGMKDTDIATVAHLYKKYGKDMLIVLLKYSGDHKAVHPSYMTTIAEKWDKAGLKTVNEAILWVDGKYGIYKKWHNRYGEYTDKPLTSNEITMYNKWYENHEEDVILSAIDKTVINTGRMALNYTDKILENS